MLGTEDNHTQTIQAAPYTEALRRASIRRLEKMAPPLVDVALNLMPTPVRMKRILTQQNNHWMI